MSRRRRLIERGEATYPATTQAAPTRTYDDPINVVAYATPPRGVQNPQGTPYRSSSSLNIGAGRAKFGAIATHGDAYDVASEQAYDATQANRAYNAYAPDTDAQARSDRPDTR